MKLIGLILLGCAISYILVLLGQVGFIKGWDCSLVSSLDY